MATVYLNGEFLPLDEACISPLDRGFVFGDGVYEVIPVYNGHLFRLTEHLRRLDMSMAGIRLRPPLDHEGWRAVLKKLVSLASSPQQAIYLQVTRGVARRDHAFPEDARPTVFAMSSPLHPMPEEIRRQGVAAVTMEDIRWRYCHLKTIALLPNILLRQEAMDRGAVEAILIRDGVVTEGAASNLFMVKDGSLLTPAKGPQLLPGITRDLIVELADTHGLPVRETAITPDALAQAEEIWLTSSTREILPVTRLDGRPVGAGVPGPLWQRMLGLYQDYKASYRS
ncbi:MAG TPA: D-amino acid aminotransferase [Gammaproteobacteria bacterium]|nr:D-amino acid aminotransferase [Gammaproteobacteria bacterium]